MLISATGISVSNSARRTRHMSRAGRAVAAGFSLIEIMIVVFIIGLVTATVVITFGGDSRDTELDREAERIEALFGYAREQAEQSFEPRETRLVGQHGSMDLRRDRR